MVQRKLAAVVLDSKMVSGVDSNVGCVCVYDEKDTRRWEKTGVDLTRVGAEA